MRSRLLSLLPLARTILILIIPMSCTRMNPVWEYRFPSNPQYIENGKRIAYFATTGESSGYAETPEAVLFYDPATRRKEKIYENPYMTGSVKVSPDGTHIVFQLRTDFMGMFDDHLEIIRVDSLGVHSRGCTFDMGMSEYWFNHAGSRVLVLGDRSRHPGLYASDLETHELSILYETTDPIVEPTVSGDDDYLAFITYTGIVLADLLTLATDTIKTAEIDSHGSIQDITFFPDADELLIAVAHQGQMVLRSCKASDPHTFKTLATLNFPVIGQLDISADGKKIFCNGGMSMMSVCLDDGEVHITDLPEICYSFDIKPDGSELVLCCKGRNERNVLYRMAWDGSDLSELLRSAD